LRDDTNRLAHAGMLDLLHDAFNHNWTATIDHDAPTGKQNGVIIRVALVKRALRAATSRELDYPIAF
jgi:hypothetical protein